MFKKIVLETLSVGDLLISDFNLWAIVIDKTPNTITIKFFPDNVVKTFSLFSEFKVPCYTTRKYPVIPISANNK